VISITEVNRYNRPMHASLVWKLQSSHHLWHYYETRVSLSEIFQMIR